MGAIAEAMLQRFQNQVPLDVGHGAADQRARHLFGGEGRVRDRRNGLRTIEAIAIGRQDRVDADLVALRHQH